MVIMLLCCFLLIVKLEKYHNALGCQQFRFVIYFNLTNDNLVWSNVFKTMFSQTLLIFKCFVAIIAQESLLLSVGYFVTLQFTWWTKTVGALVTLVWLFSSMYVSRVWPVVKSHTVNICEALLQSGPFRAASYLAIYLKNIHTDRIDEALPLCES